MASSSYSAYFPTFSTEVHKVLVIFIPTEYFKYTRMSGTGREENLYILYSHQLDSESTLAHYTVHRLLFLRSLTSSHNADAIRFGVLTFIPRRLSQARSLP